MYSQDIEKATRLLYYKTYDYNVSPEDILNGKKYEYRVASFKTNVTSSCTCTYQEVWCNGKHNSPYGIKEHNLRKAMKNRTIRYKNPIDTEYIKELLEQYPIHFEIKDLSIVVIPRNHALVPSVFINGIDELKLRAQPNSEVYKKWFNSSFLSDSLQKDWRYLLGLDYKTPSGNFKTNDIHTCFKGIWQGDPLELAVDKKSIELEIKQNHLKLYEGDKKSKMKKRETPTALRKQEKKLAQKSKKYNGPRWSQKKSDEEVSPHVLGIRQAEKIEVVKQALQFENDFSKKVKYIDGVRHVVKIEYYTGNVEVPIKPHKVQVESVKEITRLDENDKKYKVIKKKMVPVDGPTTKMVDEIRAVKTYVPEEYKGQLVYVEKREYKEVAKTIFIAKVKPTEEGDEEVYRIIKGKDGIPIKGRDPVYVGIKRLSKDLKETVCIKTLVPEYKTKSKPFKDKDFAERTTNRHQQEKLVCIKSELTGEVFRIEASRALRYTTKWFKHISKHSYKESINKETKPGLNLTDAPHRKEVRQRDPKKGAGSSYAKLQKVFAGGIKEFTTVKDKVTGKRIKTRKDVDDHGYLIDKDGKRKTETSTYLNRDSMPIYDMVPVEKSVWEDRIDPETNKTKRVLKDRVPKIVLQKDKDGKVTKSQLYKRVLRDVVAVKTTVTKTLKANKKTIVTYNFPQRISIQMQVAKEKIKEMKAAMEKDSTNTSSSTVEALST